MNSTLIDFNAIEKIFTEGIIALSMLIPMAIAIILFISLFVGIVSSFGILVSNHIITQFYKREILIIRAFPLYRSSLSATSAGLIGAFTLLVLTKSFLFASLLFFAIAFGSYWTFFRAEVLIQTQGKFLSRLKQGTQFFFIKLFLALLGSSISYFPLYNLAQNYIY